MIRRGFWLVTGAVIGVTGYRKAAQLGRTLTGAQPLGGRAAGGRALPGPRAVGGSRADEAMALQVPRAAAPRGMTPRGAAGHGGGASNAVARVASAAVFVREMRAGMAEYWDLHRGEQERGPGGRTLGSQGDSRGHLPGADAARRAGTASGASEQARREPSPARREP